MPSSFFFFFHTPACKWAKHFPTAGTVQQKVLPWTKKKKEPSSRFEARRTLYHVWYHARSGAISSGQKSRTVADRTCPSLIAPDRAWYHTWNSVLLAGNLDDGSFFFFFVQGSISLLTLYVPIIAILDIWKTTLFYEGESVVYDGFKYSMYGP